MPILHVRGLPQKYPGRIQTALTETCVAIAALYGCKPEHVWATWEDLKPGHYVEGHNSASTQPQETHPPIAQLICFEGRTSEEIEKLLQAAAKALSSGLGIPGNIFITFTEAKSGQVVAGDGILRKK
ncbi:MAG: hypothetical protein A2X86_08980 [Bdellovibrionales bacterium GWA2_49_15]|nr:MAG: hypothetical protein A2X86_08980 [Bdellovibrionales bacterium GWA2_49_15]HAZ12911.1 hypothetical protein [Bdellovibrionales bacterium]